MALRAKSVERTILVTDAAAPAGAVPGPYRLGELDVELQQVLGCEHQLVRVAQLGGAADSRL